MLFYRIEISDLEFAPTEVSSLENSSSANSQRPAVHRCSSLSARISRGMCSKSTDRTFLSHSNNGGGSPATSDRRGDGSLRAGNFPSAANTSTATCSTCGDVHSPSNASSHSTASHARDDDARTETAHGTSDVDGWPFASLDVLNDIGALGESLQCASPKSQRCRTG